MLKKLGYVGMALLQVYVAVVVILDMWNACIYFMEIFIVGILFLIFWMVILTDAQPQRGRRKRENHEHKYGEPLFNPGNGIYERECECGKVED